MLGPSGHNEKHKARYVANDFKQVEKLDYLENFEQTCQTDTFRILFELSVKQRQMMRLVDMRTVFLHTSREKEIYLVQTRDFVKRGQD